MNDVILSVQDIYKTFSVDTKKIKAVDGVSFDVNRGECFAIVGESGSGKSTVANMILGLYPPTDGKLVFNKENLTMMRDRSLRRRIQLVQQNPLSALNSRRSIEKSLRLALDVHNIGERSQRKAQVIKLLEEVGLDASFAKRSPVGLSGGQRQRVAIARALACRSDLIVLDEPTSALDVLVQAQVLKLLNQLKESHGLTYVFITHDLSVVRNMADRVAVFEKGRIVELDDTETIFSNPSHEYTRALISAVPVITDDEIYLRDKLAFASSESSRKLNKE